MTLNCLNCNNPINNPTRKDQKFCKRKCFDEYRVNNPRSRAKKVSVLKDILPPAPSTPAPVLPPIEDMTINQIKQELMMVRSTNLEISVYKHKYLELLEKIRDLIPKEKEQDNNKQFILEDGCKVPIGKAIRIKDGLSDILRTRKPQPPSEEFIVDLPKGPEDPKSPTTPGVLEAAVNPILKSDEEPVLSDFKELD